MLWDRRVAEYDAFGRKIGEDPLESLGWQAEPPATAPPKPASSAIVAEPAESAPAAPAPAAQPPPARPTFVRRRPRRRGAMARLLVLAGVAGAVGLFALGGDAVRDAPEVGVPAEVPDRVPVGLQRGSLLRPADFAAAMRRLREERLGRLTLVRVAPERIDARLLTRGGRLRSVQVRHDGELRAFAASGGGFGFVDTFAFSSVDAAVPERLTRAAAKRLGRPVTRLDYLVVTATGGDIRWGAYFKGGQYFLADARGRIIRRVA